MIVKLSDGVEVTLKDKLKYGDRCKIRIAKGMIESDGETKKKSSNDSIDESPEMLSEMMKMVSRNSVETEIVAMECFITKIVKGEEVISDIREYINEKLDEEDAQKILEHVKPFIKKATDGKKK